MHDPRGERAASQLLTVQAPDALSPNGGDVRTHVGTRSREGWPVRGSNRRDDPLDRVGVSCGLAESGLDLAGARCRQVIAEQSPELSDQSARAVESEVRAGLALDFRICGRVAGVPYLVADDRCRIPRSGSA